MTLDQDLTAEDRLRLHVHDPLTFAFVLDDAEQLVAEIDALRAAIRPKEAGQAGEPHVLCERAEERLCECGAAGSNEEHEDWCQWLGSEWHRWESVLSAPAAVTVGVKPLQWPKPTVPHSRITSGGGLLMYTIAQTPPVCRWAREHGGWSDEYPSLDAAKAAAQSDYETRIRSALTSPPGETAQVEAVAWRYRDARGRWAYCEAIDNTNGPTVITEKQALYASPPLSAKESPEQLRERCAVIAEMHDHRGDIAAAIRALPLSTVGGQ